MRLSSTVPVRLWTVHPRYLDAKGLVAAWREGLLAQKVLQGGTRGYKHHSQLRCFRSHTQPVQAIAAFLAGLAQEARLRGYNFDHSKIARRRLRTQIDETRGQLIFEWGHLRAKLRRRAPSFYREVTENHFAQAAPTIPNCTWRCEGLGEKVIGGNASLL